MTQRLFKLHDKRILGHLNYIGMILFSSLVIIALTFYHDLAPTRYLVLYSFICIYVIGTANINRCMLPYGKQKPGLVYISKRLLLRHLFFTITTGYSLQFLLAVLVSVTCMVVLHEYLIVFLALGSVVVSFLSQLTSIFVKVIIRVIFLLQLWSILASLIGVSAILLAVQLLIIYFYISNYHRIPHGPSFLKGSENRHASGSMSQIFLFYVINNKILLILLGAVVSVIMYFCQQLLNGVHGIPATILIYINFMTIVEILVGSKREEIMIDKSRVETLQSSLIVSPFKRFKASSIYLYSLMLMVTAALGLVGIFLNAADTTAIIKSVLSIPLTLLIGVIYYRKTELLTSGNESKILKLTLPILILIFVTFFTIGA